MPRTINFDKGTGWRPDIPSQLDKPHLFKASGPQRTDKVDAGLAFRPHAHSKNFLKLKHTDQRQTSACTGHSSSYHWADEHHLSPRSPTYAYWYGRKAINETDIDEGAYIRDVFDGLAHEGNPRDDLWPDRDDNIFIPPNAKAEADAVKRLPVSRHRIDEPTELDLRTAILTCISAGHSFVSGVSCFDSFFSDRSIQTGLFLVPSMSESFQGGHALCFGEYWLNDLFAKTPEAQLMRQRGIPDSLFPKEVVRARGSWGTQYLLDGDHFFDLAYIIDRNLADDTWTTRAK